LNKQSLNTEEIKKSEKQNTKSKEQDTTSINNSTTSKRGKIERSQVEQEHEEGHNVNTEGKKRKKKKLKSDETTSEQNTGLSKQVLQQLRTHADVTEEQINTLINQDFDPVEFDKQMAEIFNQKYYEQVEETHPYPEGLEESKKKKKNKGKNKTN